VPPCAPVEQVPLATHVPVRHCDTRSSKSRRHASSHAVVMVPGRASPASHAGSPAAVVIAGRTVPLITQVPAPPCDTQSGRSMTAPTSARSRLRSVRDCRRGTHQSRVQEGVPVNSEPYPVVGVAPSRLDASHVVLCRLGRRFKYSRPPEASRPQPDAPHTPVGTVIPVAVMSSCTDLRQ